MAVESLAIALHHSRSRGTTKLVLLGIANHDGDGGSWPSIATLAKYAACSPREVQRSIARLIELGEITRFVQQGGSHRTPDHLRPSRFRFDLKCPLTCDRSKNHRITEEPQPAIVPNLWTNPVTYTSPGDAYVTGGVTHTSPGGVTHTSPEPSLGTSSRTASGSVPAPPQTARDPDARKTGMTRWCPEHDERHPDPGVCRGCAADRLAGTTR